MQYLVVNPGDLVVLPGPQVGGLLQVPRLGQAGSVLGGADGSHGGWFTVCTRDSNVVKLVYNNVVKTVGFQQHVNILPASTV